MERRLHDADFESSRCHEQIAFEDKETDMTEFEFHLLKQQPSQATQATVEMTDS